MGKKELIKSLKEDLERVCGSILAWEEKRLEKVSKVLAKIEKKGSDVFTRHEKVLISEWAEEFGQHAGKIPIFMKCIEFLTGGAVSYPSSIFPNIYRYLTTHRFYPPTNIKIEN